MAKLMLIGNVAHVWLTTDPEDGQIIATCLHHPSSFPILQPELRCSWTERYDDLGDASEYAADHADRGTA
jgi:hypothetical protein